VRQVGQLLR